MKPFFSKITSTTLALLVLLSTFSFTVEKHYCGGFLMDVSFVGNAGGCRMEMTKTAVFKIKNCCKSEIHKIKGQDELQPSSKLKFDFQKQPLFATFLISYKSLFVDINSKKIVSKNFSPPDIPIDYQVLHQSFLI
ncbi:hypothetical protein JL193_11785 [Polaribacter batillariae]|uniref:Secreted protein n=1 Tax=Polaribacter batillariae TaxID=2808900 RepID=A0ABX7STY2_9FLAO|nr:hypothetical protein [Polaribacter batillariae]QTD36810.1 hypothetical protein JL193_11785 [Polaribacter batillariae]